MRPRNLTAEQYSEAVLIDTALPEGEGKETNKVAWCERHGKKWPAVFFTGNPDARDHCEERGFSKILSNPGKFIVGGLS